ncbi:phosphoglucomutase domain protein, partial [Vibrio harveyi]
VWIVLLLTQWLVYWH